MSWTIQVSGLGDESQAELDRVTEVCRKAVQELRVRGCNPTYASVGGNGPSPDMAYLLREQESDRLQALPPVGNGAPGSTESPSAAPEAPEEAVPTVMAHGPASAYPAG